MNKNEEEEEEIEEEIEEEVEPEEEIEEEEEEEEEQEEEEEEEEEEKNEEEGSNKNNNEEIEEEEENTNIIKETTDEDLTKIIEKEEDITNLFSLTNSNQFKENVEKDYYSQKGITKRTIGIGKVNVKVYEEEEDESIKDEIRININNEKSINNEIIQEKSLQNNLNNLNELSESKISEFNKEKEKQSESSTLPILIEEIKIKNKNKMNEGRDNRKKSKVNKYKNKNKIKSIKYNIDGKKFIIKVIWFFTYKEERTNINIKLSTIYPGSQIMHWGVFTSNSPIDWYLPPKEYYPRYTYESDFALETKFETYKEKIERIISIILPKKLNNNENIEGIYFVIYDPIKNLWYNNFNKNFKIKFNFN